MKAGTIVGTGTSSLRIADGSPHRSVRNVTPSWMVGATGAKDEVDVGTGQVRVSKLVNVVDARKPLNPHVVDPQVFGTALMQLGSTLFEEMFFDGGQPTNASLADYKIPGMLDVTASVTNETVEAEERGGPLKAKGVGDSGTFSVSPPMANAIDDAVRMRMMSLPSRRTVYRAMKAKG